MGTFANGAKGDAVRALINGLLTSAISNGEEEATVYAKINAIVSHPNSTFGDVRAKLNALLSGGATPTVTISAAQSKAEGNSGATLFTYTVTRSATSGATSVPWSFAAGGTSADDFTGGTYPAGGTVAMADGVATGTFTVSVAGDVTVEPDETFTVSIAAPAGYALGSPSSATGTILNDDTAPVATMKSLAVRDATLLDTDANGFGIDGNGWIAEIVVPNATAGGTADPTKVTIVVSDPGYDTAKNAVTRTRTIVGGAVMRRMYPNHATKMVEQVGGDVRVRFSLSEPLYANTTIQSVTVASGFYPGAAAGTATTLTNSSTRAYPPPMFAWHDLPFERASASTHAAECSTFHYHAMNGQQVACVEFYAKDASGHTTPGAVVGTPSVSTLLTKGQPTECWSGAVDISTLTNGDACLMLARVYPWIGSAPFDLDTQGLDQPTALRSYIKLPFLCDRLGTYAGVRAYVDAAASYTPISAGTLASAIASAFDLDDQTYVLVNGSGYWAGAQFNLPVNVRQVRLLPAKDYTGNFPDQVVFEWSDDGTTWTAKGTTFTTTAPVLGAYQAFDLGAGGTAHAYWRVRQPNRSGDFLSLGEIVFARTVGGTAVTAPGVASQTDATAKARPFGTIEAAVTALQNANSALGHNDLSGSIYLMDNAGADITHRYDGMGGTPGKSWLNVRKDVGATGKVSVAAKNNITGICSRTRFGDGVIVVADQLYPFYANGTGSGTSDLAFDGCSFSHVSGNATADFRRLHFRNVPFLTSFFTITNRTPTFSMLGCNNDAITPFAFGSSTPSPSNGILTNSTIGCRIHGAEFGSSRFSDTNLQFSDTTPDDGKSLFNNLLLHLLGTGQPFNPVAFGGANIQNVMIWQGTTGSAGSAVYSVTADGNTSSAVNFLEFHNVILGERGNRMYTDVAGSRGKKKYMSLKYGIIHGYNCKTDTVANGDNGSTNEGTGRVDNWEVRFGVGYDFNILRFGTRAAEYLGDYWRSDTLIGANAEGQGILPAFVDNQAGTFQLNGAGGGDYHLTGTSNIAYNRVASGKALLRYDLGGVRRLNDGRGACGAYERTDVA